MCLFQQLRHVQYMLNNSLYSIPIRQYVSSNVSQTLGGLAVDAVFSTYGIILAN